MNAEIQTVRNWLRFFIVVLFLSGLTAIPVEKELSFLADQFPFEGSIKDWLTEVLLSVRQTGKDYPYLFYGYDWLAFAHFVLAILFIGPLRDPVRNKWVIEFGLISSLLVIPFALVAGHYRGIPFWWQLIDCSFGVIGFALLIMIYNKIMQLEKLQSKPGYHED